MLRVLCASMHVDGESCWGWGGEYVCMCWMCLYVHVSQIAKVRTAPFREPTLSANLLFLA